MLIIIEHTQLSCVRDWAWPPPPTACFLEYTYGWFVIFLNHSTLYFMYFLSTNLDPEGWKLTSRNVFTAVNNECSSINQGMRSRSTSKNEKICWSQERGRWGSLICLVSQNMPGLSLTLPDPNERRMVGHHVTQVMSEKICCEPGWVVHL